jgi:uncharacterized membrane protein YkoI
MFAMAFAVMAALAGPASAECLSQAQARQAVESGQARPWSQIRAGLGGAINGNVVDTQLCQSGGGLVYVVSVLSGDGSVHRLTVDARSGALLSQ